jgi:hypothetical protein
VPSSSSAQRVTAGLTPVDVDEQVFDKRLLVPKGIRRGRGPAAVRIGRGE